jgi:hypothetical protein
MCLELLDSTPLAGEAQEIAEANQLKIDPPALSSKNLGNFWRRYIKEAARSTSSCQQFVNIHGCISIDLSGRPSL